MAPRIEKILDNFKLAEGPHWDANKQCLYFVSMIEHKIFRYVPSTKKLTTAKIGNYNVSIIIPVKDTEDQFVITVDRGVAIITWDGESSEVSDLKKIYEVDDDTEHVFNDGKCDASGRLWTGTMGHTATSLAEIPDATGTLYSFKNNTVSSHRKNVGISNGIAFDRKLKKMYYIDSYRLTVDQYDFDIENGIISNMKPIFNIKTLGLENDCSELFDGMTIDTEGNLWIAVFNGSKVIKIDPRRPDTLLDTITFPAVQITSVTFGGANLDELYVTSGRLDENSIAENGSLYRVTGINAKGVPADEFVF